jgi:hypothetical protein
MEKAPRRKFARLRWLLHLAVILVLYVLSIGPLRYAIEKGWFPKGSAEFAEMIYFPLVWAGERNEAIDNALSAYSDWWANLANPSPAADPEGLAP